MRRYALPAMLLLAGAACPAAAAQLDGSLMLGGQSTGRGNPAGTASLEFNLQGDTTSLSGRFSGAYTPGADGKSGSFEASEALLEFRSPLADLSVGDISPAFSDYTLSSPSLEDGAELALKASGFSLKPVYLRLSKAQAAGATYERNLYGAALSKDDLPLGFSLGAGAWRAADEESSLAGYQPKRPSGVTTLGLKAGFKADEVFNAFYEYSRSGADADLSVATGTVYDQAFKGGAALDWDNWNVAVKYSRCGKSYQAAGVDAVDADQGKLSADLAYAFSEHISARLSESRITDGVSKGRNSRVHKQNSMFALDLGLPGLPSLNLDYSASRNSNRLRLVHEETQDYGYSLNYAAPALPGLVAMASGRLSKAKDYTRRTDPSRTLAQNYGVTLPWKFLAEFVLAPNYSVTASENTRTGSRTYSEAASAALTLTAFSGKAILSVSASKTHNYDNRNTSDNESRAVSAQLALSPAAPLKVALGATATTTDDKISPAASGAARQYTISTTLSF